MPGTNSSPTSTAGSSVAQGQASRSWLCPTQMPWVPRDPARGFQLQGARVLSVVHGEADEWRERSPWGAQSLALGHHGRKSHRARAAAFNRAVAQGQASRRQWVLTFPFSWRPRLAQEREACPWGTVSCSAESHRSSWIARSLALGHDRVFYRDPQGHRASMPVGWTSLAPPDPYVAVAAGRSRFRLQDLIDLAALIAGGRR